MHNIENNIGFELLHPYLDSLALEILFLLPLKMVLRFPLSINSNGDGGNLSTTNNILIIHIKN